MIMWDRIKRNLDSGLTAITRVSARISERTRIEMAVARLMVEKGKLESNAERLHQRLGERVYVLWERGEEDVLKDGEVLDVLRELEKTGGQISSVALDIRKASLGGEES